MAHGTPDWGVTAGAVTTYQLSDMAELAARLGSPVTWDRRGEVIWWDDFEWGLTKWTGVIGGLNGSIALSTVRARNGRRSCALSAGADAGRFAEIYHYNAKGVNSRVGVEVWFSQGAAIEVFRVEETVYDGVNSTTFGVQWENAGNRLLYLNAAGAYTEFASAVDLMVQTTLFHSLKVVGDAATDLYVRCILDDREYSLAGIGGWVSGSGERPAISLVLVAFGSPGQNDTVFVDDVILTQNEPA